MRNKTGMTPIIGAAANNQIAIVKLLIARGADVNAKITGGQFAGKSALSFALQRNLTEMITILKNAGARE